jgi:hypothetical protein
VGKKIIEVIEKSKNDIMVMIFFLLRSDGVKQPFIPVAVDGDRKNKIIEVGQNQLMLLLLELTVTRVALGYPIEHSRLMIQYRHPGFKRHRRKRREQQW